MRRAKAKRNPALDRIAERPKAALSAAKQYGWRYTREQVAAIAGVSPACVTHYYDMGALRKLVKEAAMQSGEDTIITENT